MILMLLLCLGCKKEEKELKSIDVVIYVNSSATDSEIKNIENKLKNIDLVDNDSIRFQSKDEVKEEMMENNDTFKNLMKDWDNNPLQSVYIIKVIDNTKIQEVVKEIESIDKVEVVKYDALSINN
jgi:cell division protein FtsX